MIKNIVFAGTPDTAAKLLQDLIQHSINTNNDINIVACYTQPDRPKGRYKQLACSPVKELAIKHKIPVIQPPSLKSSTVIANLKKLQPDLMIVFAYGLILPKEILGIPKYGCFNVHTSLLPKWRGAAPIQHAILAGDQRSGINIIKMDEGLDTGDVYYSRSCLIDPLDTTASLTNKLQPIATTAILEVIKQLNDKQTKPIPQNHCLATYAHKISKDDGKIDWSLPAIKIDRIIRAFIPTPVAFTKLDDITVRIWQAKLIPESIFDNYLTQIPGKIIDISKQGIIVATAAGGIKLEKIQLPGSKVLKIAELLNSNKYLNLLNRQNIKFI